MNPTGIRVTEYEYPMASYAVNRRGVAQARKLIKAKRYVLASNWGDVQPKAASENAFLKEHSWQDYSDWFLGLRCRRDQGALCVRLR
jgi:hypothetical protein